MSGMLVAAVYDDVIIATPLINQGEDKVMTIDEAIVYSKKKQIPFLTFGLSGKLKRKIKKGACTVKAPVIKIRYSAIMGVPGLGAIMQVNKRRNNKKEEWKAEDGYYCMSIGEAQVFQSYFKQYEFDW